jgi:peptidoglycan hydrolase-like protein with peptidoglycan-binding domain
MVKSVGDGGVNDMNDVGYAQLLLNSWLASQNLGLLTIDGIYGPNTGGAITTFQQDVTGIVDGRLDPGAVGIRSLEQAHVEVATAGVDPAQVQAIADSPLPTNAEEISEAPDDQVPPADPIAALDITQAATEAMQEYLDEFYVTAVDEIV